MSRITDEDILKEFQSTGSKRQSAQNLGMSRTTFRRRFDQIEPRMKVDITGITPKTTSVDPAKVVNDLIKQQESKEYLINLSRNQRVNVGEDEPFVLALFADLHIGNNKTDYKNLFADAEMVRDCPFCLALTAGDHHENWIGKLGWIAREQSMSLNTEHAVVKHWFDIVGDSLIAVCAGNHDNRSILAAGIDYIRSLIGDKVLLYDMDQILFNLQVRDTEIVFKIRHMDKYRSILNPFHGAFRDLERGDCNWDVYISGHDHRATLFADYVHYDKKKIACRIGTYKMDDRFGKFLGFPKSFGTGSGALVIEPTGEVHSFTSIRTAIEFCSWMRG